MIVVSNTTPLHYLVLIEEAIVLERLFERILIPRAVLRELDRDEVPTTVRNWIRAPVAWLGVQTVAEVDPALKLGAGEREAIALAESRRADLLLLDDRGARQAAMNRGLPVTGTLGVLERAARQNLVDLPEMFERLRWTNFRASPAAYETVLRRYHEPEWIRVCKFLRSTAY